MATVTTPPRPVIHRDELHRKVVNPLERLRSWIRVYVSLEGLLVLCVYLALWFWIGLLLDYGCFKLFTIDWVQELPGWFRTGVLVVLSSGLIALVVLKVVLRLVRDFRKAPLALVLERRFPKLLGDRLITAVELADPGIGAKYGYSQQMIDRTIDEAAGLVDKVPVKDAFNWRRLYIYTFALIVFTAGFFGLAAASHYGWCWLTAPSKNAPANQDNPEGSTTLTAASDAAKPDDPDNEALAGTGSENFTGKFYNVSAIWFERNILLRNVIWPRQAHLELVNFPDNDDLRVGRTAGTANIRVRAVKWVIEDVKDPEGWRALRWSDLKTRPELLAGTPLPELPETFDKNRDYYVDEIEREIKKPELRQELKTRDQVVALDKVMATLVEQSSRGAMTRKLRRLAVPDTVMVYYSSPETRSEMSLKQEGNNEYSGVFTELKESIQFRAVAKDYATRTRTITVVPPPVLTGLSRQEWQPAYLHHLPPIGGSAADLKGRKQVVLSGDPIFVGGDTTRLDIPAGSDIELTGVADKDLESVRIVPRQEKVRPGEAAVPSPLTDHPVRLVEEEDPKTKAMVKRKFSARFNNVQGRLDFEFQFTDADGVMGRRHIVIQAKDDATPEVEVFVEGIRKTAQGTYMITPQAKLPFSGRVSDDHGLTAGRYMCSYAMLEEAGALRARGSMIAQLIPLLVPDGPTSCPQMMIPFVAANTAKNLATEAERPADAYSLGTLEQRLQEKAADALAKPTYLAMLDDPKAFAEWSKKPGGKPIIPTHDLNAELESFDLEKHLPGLRVTSESSIQPRYRLKLWVSATDTNVESGPRTGESKERFTFMIVPEFELINEISKEEATLLLKLDQVIDKLKNTKTDVDQVLRDLNAADFNPKEQFSPLGTRMLSVADAVNGSSITTKEIWTECARILKETELNRLPEKYIGEKRGGIVAPLESAVNTEFVRAEEAARSFQKNLDERRMDKEGGNKALARMEELIAKLEKAKEGFSAIISDAELRQLLQRNIAEQEDVSRGLRELNKRIMDIIFGDDEPERK